MFPNTYLPPKKKKTYLLKDKNENYHKYFINETPLDLWIEKRNGEILEGKMDVNVRISERNPRDFRHFQFVVDLSRQELSNALPRAIFFSPDGNAKGISRI